ATFNDSRPARWSEFNQPGLALQRIAALLFAAPAPYRLFYWKAGHHRGAFGNDRYRSLSRRISSRTFVQPRCFHPSRHFSHSAGERRLWFGGRHFGRHVDPGIIRVVAKLAICGAVLDWNLVRLKHGGGNLDIGR